jgi:hypothetical protein
VEVVNSARGNQSVLVVYQEPYCLNRHFPPSLLVEFFLSSLGGGEVVAADHPHRHSFLASVVMNLPSFWGLPKHALQPGHSYFPFDLLPAEKHLKMEA